jgi:hypothetical protein|nr:MAG TPA: restriction enzyme [Caudoviricetes sp.]
MYQNEEHKQSVEERGDGYEYIGTYRCDEMTMDGKNKKGKSNYIRIKCPYCDNEYDIQLSSFKKGAKCTNCCNFYENSFAYYIQQELQEPLNKYWDWNDNELNPYHIYKNSTKKVKIKCIEKNYHGNYSIDPHHFYDGKRCPYCCNFHGKVHPKDSFGQWLINNYGEDAVEKYWSSKNTIDPFTIAPQSGKKVWILCQNKDYHNDNGGYETTVGNFYYGNRCPYCSSQKVHPKDSFGILYPDKARYWSKNNKKSPFDVLPYSNKKYKFICEKCGGEFKRSLYYLNVNSTGVICRECRSSQLEQATKKVLDRYNIKYHREYSYNDLIGVSNGLLRFDFYLPDYNTLIECQGIQHEKWQEGWQTEKDFEDLQIHDQRKKDYCKIHNIPLIEIWYYDIDNIENILIEEVLK